MIVIPDSTLSRMRLVGHHRTTRTCAGPTTGEKLIRRTRGIRVSTRTTKHSRVAELAARTEAEDMAPDVGSATAATTKNTGAAMNSPRKDDTRAVMVSSR
jgi:hypothetical protein